MKLNAMTYYDNHIYHTDVPYGRGLTDVLINLQISSIPGA